MADLKTRDLRLVVLVAPIETWENPATRDLFHELVALKMKGYGSEYPEGVLPVDATDFVGTHLAVCKYSKDGALKPLMAYKSVTLAQCDKYRLTFPALTTLQSSGAQASLQVVESILQECRERNNPISYDSCWTTAQELRREGTSKALRNIMTALGVFHHRDYAIPQWITCGVLRFKTDIYFQWMGLNPITSVFPQHSLFGEQVRMHHLTSFSPAAIEAAQPFEEMWAQRSEINRVKPGERSAA